MKQALRASFFALPLAAIVAVAACSDDPDTATYDVALSIVGNGRVVTAPAGFDCTGPSDCGTHAYTAGTAVSLTSAPAAGYALTSVTVDSVLVSDGTVHPGTGATTRVVVTFSAIGGEGGGDPGDASAPDAGPSDAGADAGPTPCTTADGCGTGSVCCLRNGDVAANLLAPTSTCETTDACRTGAGRPLCSGANDTQHCSPESNWFCRAIVTSPTGYACFPAP